MSDAAPPVRTEPTADGRRPAAPLTPDHIDAAVADFRAWLNDLTSAGREPPAAEPPAVDLFTLVAQFTALRHEVNLQTKAARAATEQTAEAVTLLANPPSPPDPTEAVRPLVKALVDIADALAVSLRNVEKARTVAEAALEPAPWTPPPRGLLARLFAPPPEPLPPSDSLAKLPPLLAGVADGYALSLRRVERALTQAGVEAIACEGRAFDPELMEVVEAVAADGRPPGTVVEETRRGYRWNGTLLRYAQVKVAR